MECEEVKDLDPAHEQSSAEEQVPDVDEKAPVVLRHEEGGDVYEHGHDAKEDNQGLDPGEASLGRRIGQQ